MGSELAPGRDPRDPPFEDKERDAAAEALLDKRRWHRRNGADWLAARLLYGRGRESSEVSAAFGVGQAIVQDRARKEKWTRAMTEDDRRDMARRVWLAGWARLARGEAVDFGALRAASEWRVAPKVAEKPLWVSRAAEAGSAASQGMTVQNMTGGISDEGFDDDYGADPKREERETIRRKLDELLERLEADARDAGQDGALSEGDGDAGGGGEISGDDGAGVAGVG